MKAYIVIFEYYGSELVRNVVGIYNDRIEAIGHVYDNINDFIDDHKSSMRDYKLSKIEFDGVSGYEYVDLTIEYDDNNKDEHTWWIFSTDGYVY